MRDRVEKFVINIRQIISGLISLVFSDLADLTTSHPHDPFFVDFLKFLFEVWLGSVRVGCAPQGQYLVIARNRKNVKIREVRRG